MFAPASASLRSLNAFRYFVLSYVTKPTTISAMTEIPANTPKPIGSTEIFLPGITKGAADAEGAESAADVPFAAAAPETSVLVAAGGAVVGAEDAALLGLGEDGVTVGVPEGVADGAMLDGMIVETIEAGIDEKP